MMKASITSPIFTSPNFSMVMPPHAMRSIGQGPVSFHLLGRNEFARHQVLASRGPKRLVLVRHYTWICSTASRWQIFSVGRPVLCRGGGFHAVEVSDLDLLHDEGLNYVPNLDVVELLNGNAALVALGDLLDVVLEALEGGDGAVVDGRYCPA